MKKLFLTAAAAMAIAAPVFVAAPASAEETGISYSGNVALTTDYVFRGVSQTGTNPAIQGGFDASYGEFYAGTWASNVAFGGSVELDLYAGWKPTIGPVGLDFAVLGYFYPGASDAAAELDYQEFKAAASFSPVEKLTIGGAAFFSPEFYGETGEALYLEANAGFAVTDAVSVSAAYGVQTIDDVDGPGAGTADGDYATWNLGGTYSLAGFGFDLRYIDTDIDTADSIATFTTADEYLYDETVVFTVKRAL